MGAFAFDATLLQHVVGAPWNYTGHGGESELIEKLLPGGVNGAVDHHSTARTPREAVAWRCERPRLTFLCCSHFSLRSPRWQASRAICSRSLIAGWTCSYSTTNIARTHGLSCGRPRRVGWMAGGSVPADPHVVTCSSVSLRYGYGGRRLNVSLVGRGAGVTPLPLTPHRSLPFCARSCEAPRSAAVCRMPDIASFRAGSHAVPS
jgi:hypothetical protein